MSSFLGIARLSPVALAGLAVIGLTLGPARAIAGGEGWSHDVAAAMKQAKDEKKDLLLDFTGSDWCGWCIKLNEEVFSQEPFKADAKEHFVLVEFDFPNDKSKLNAETQQQNEEWNQKLAVRGYPTIFVADEEGRPYAQTGYQPGGAEAYVAHLAELRAKRATRDAALTAAAQAAGVEKAKLLDAALEVVGEELALNAYADQVRELIQADADNQAGLRSKYEQKLAGAEFDKAIAKLDSTFDGKNGEELIKALDQAIEQYQPDAGRVTKSALNQRLRYLLAAEKLEEGLALVNSLSAADGHDVSMKLNLGFARVNVLRKLGRDDDAVKALDEIVEAAPPENDLKARIIATKALTLFEMGRKEDAMKAFDAATAAASKDEIKDQIQELKEKVANKDAAPAVEATPVEKADK
jgi:thioredoxin-related protein